MVRAMEVMRRRRRVPAVDGPRVPAHVITGPALLAVRLSEEARGVRGLDVLRRSVDRAPPVPA
jgi:hypothetical protein